MKGTRMLYRLWRPVIRRSVFLSAFLAKNPVARYRCRHLLMRSLSRRWDFRVYEEYTTWAEDEECLAVWRAFPEGEGELIDRHFNLYHLAKSVQKIPGDTAECGVFRGRGSWFILNANGPAAKTHHLFDSFAGLSEPSAEDRPTTREAFRWKKHLHTAGEEPVRHNLARFAEKVMFHPGWIPERFSEVEQRRFSFVHIDVDLYQPTYDSLAFFYERTNAGGIIVCDDYGFSTCPGARLAMDRFFEDKPEAVVALTTGQAMVVRG